MGLLTQIVIAVIVLAITGLGVGTFFSGVMKEAEMASNNPLVQNATGEAKEFVDDKVASGIGNTISNNGIGSVLVMTLGNATYNQGKPVTFTIDNNSEEALAFPNSAFGLEITNTDTGKMLPIFAAQVITSIESGESKLITLQLEDGNGQPAGAGNYLAKVYTTSRGSGPTAEVNFIILEK